MPDFENSDQMPNEANEKNRFVSCENIGEFLIGRLCRGEESSEGSASRSFF